MAIEFDCPACEATIRVGEKAIGKKGRCPKCGVLLLVPDPDDFEDDEEVEEDEEEVAVEPTESEPPVDEPEPEPEPVPAHISEQVDGPVFISVDPAVYPGEEERAADPPPMIEETIAPPQAAETVVPTADVSTSQTDEAASPPAAPAPAPFDPDNPFAFAGPATTSKAATYSRHRRRKPPMSTRAKISWGAAVGAVLLLGVGAWLLYVLVSPDLAGELTGERFRSVELPAVTFAAPAKGVTSGDVATVMDILTNEGLPLRSEYIDVRLSATGGQPQVSIGPGPRSRPVRVALGQHAGIQAVLSQQRDAIMRLKQQELNAATAGLYRDYAAYVDKGTPITNLAEYRDKVGLNASVGAVGYAIEADISGNKFLCAYEDAEGHCYFFLPQGISTFQIRGRQLDDGSTPLPVDFTVTLVDSETPVLAAPEPSSSEPKDGEKSKDDEKAKDEETAEDEKAENDEPSAEEKPAPEMKDESSDMEN